MSGNDEQPDRWQFKPKTPNWGARLTGGVPIFSLKLGCLSCSCDHSVKQADELVTTQPSVDLQVVRPQETDELLGLSTFPVEERVRQQPQPLARSSSHCVSSACYDDSDSEPEVHHQTSDVTLLEHYSLRERVSETITKEEMHWANAMLEIFWPKMNSVIRQVLNEKVVPKIQSSSPMLGGFNFNEFTIGEAVPEIGPIQICLATNYQQVRILELHIDVAWDSNAHFTMDFQGSQVGLESIAIQGTVVVQMYPLIEDIPVIGGFAFYLMDTPKLNYKFSGVSHVADMPVLAKAVRSQINNLVAQSLCLPNKIVLPLGKEDQGVDVKEMRSALAIGMLRVTAQCARGLIAHDQNLFSKASSDPYLKLHLGREEWHSSTVFGTCDPNWESEFHDFVVYDAEQRLHVDVVEGGIFHSHDILGSTKPLSVSSTLSKSRKPIPLFHPDANLGTTPDKQCGSVQFTFQWFESVPWFEGSEVTAVHILIDSLWLPPDMKSFVAVRARLRGVEKTTALANYKTVERKNNLRVFLPGDAGLPMINAANIPLPKSEEASYGDGDLKVDIEFILELVVHSRPGEFIQRENLEIAVVDGIGHVRGEIKIPMVDILNNPKHKFPEKGKKFPDILTKKGEVIKGGIEIAVSAMRLEQDVARAQKKLKYKKIKKDELKQKVSQSRSLAWRLLDGSHSHHKEYAGPDRPLLAKAEGDSLHWTNVVAHEIWPKMDKAIGKVIYDRMQPALQDALPVPFKGANFLDFTVGKDPLKLNGIKLFRAPLREDWPAGWQGLDLRLSLDFRATTQMQLSLFRRCDFFALGIKEVTFKGVLTVRISPLLDKLPLLGGVSFFFLDPPEVHLVFAGMTKIANMSAVSNVLRNMIQTELARALVLPNMVGIAIGKEDQGVDAKLIRSAKLQGVLMVSVLNSNITNLGVYRTCSSSCSMCHCWKGLSRLCSTGAQEAIAAGPYLRFTLADDRFDVGVGQRNRRAHGFMVFSFQQKLQIELCERTTVLGRSKPMTVEEAMQATGAPVEIFEKQEERSAEASFEKEPKRQCGTVKLDFRWASLAKRFDMNELGKHGFEASCILKLRLDEVYMRRDAAEIAGDQIRVIATIKDKLGLVKSEKTTPVIKYKPDKGAEAEEADAKIEQIEFAVEYVLHLHCSARSLRWDKLDLAIVDKRRNELGKATLPLSELQKSSYKSKYDSLQFDAPKTSPARGKGIITGQVEVVVEALKDEESPVDDGTGSIAFGRVPTMMDA